MGALHIGLLAEARSDQTGLNDAIQVSEGLLNAIEQVEHNAMSTCMVLSYRKMLFKEIDASETLLAECQEKLNKLTDIYSSSCSVTNQLKASISSCKRKLIKTKKRSQHALPDRGLDTPTASPLVCSDAKSLKGFVSQDLEKIESERKQKMVEEILPYRIEEATEEPGRSVSTLKNPETSSTDYSGIQEMFMEAPGSSCKHGHDDDGTGTNTAPEIIAGKDTSTHGDPLPPSAPCMAQRSPECMTWSTPCTATPSSPSILCMIGQRFPVVAQPTHARCTTQKVHQL